jgi:exopolyphosphatase / guanosine-5'-triphosphate,3'-diphosphate pyrophosphatase
LHKGRRYDGRIADLEPVAIVDIGSNSVRLVVYEGARRAPTPVFNEKVLCGLGRGIATTGKMSQSSIDHALRTLSRFNILNRHLGVLNTYAIATAAARDAKNGADFIKAASHALDAPIKVLSGKKEAKFAAYGVMSVIPDAHGIAGDLGGGSLELVEIDAGKIGAGATLPLGPLRLADIAGDSQRKANDFINQQLDRIDFMDGDKEIDFYAIGGTWRNLARLHIVQNDYPLNVLNNYVIPANEARKLISVVGKLSQASLRDIKHLSAARAETLPLGAMVLDALLRRNQVRNLVISSNGVREGVLYSKLSKKERRQDPLLAACNDLAVLRSRSRDHMHELISWTDQLFKKSGLEESKPQRRLRHAACLVADIGWRAHPDFRGQQSLNIIAHAAFSDIDHAGRAFIALSVFHRHSGDKQIQLSRRLKELIDDETVRRVFITSAAFRLAYSLSGAMPGILPEISLKFKQENLILKVPKEFQSLVGGTVERRLAALAKQVGCAPVIKTRK